MQTLALLIALALPQDSEFKPEAYLEAHQAADAALLTGNSNAARLYFQRCLDYSPANPTLAYGLACVEARAGNVNLAFAHLEQAMEWGYLDAAVAAWDEDLSSLRKDPRFNDRLARMNTARGARVLGVSLGCVTYVKDQRPGPATIDPAGRLIAMQAGEGEILLLDAPTGAEVRRWDALPAEIWSLAFSPDSELLVGLSFDGSVGIFEVSSGAARFTAVEFDNIGDHRYPFGALIEFDPTGKRILVGAAAHGGVLLNRDGTLIRRLEEPFGSFFGIRAAWSPDGAGLATIVEGKIVIRDGSTGERQKDLTNKGKAYSLDYSPDGKYLAVGTDDDGHVFILALETGQVVRTLQARDLFMSDIYVPVVDFSPDGSKLAYSSATSINVMIDAVHEHKQVFTSDFHGGRMGEPVEVQFSPDGSKLWYAWRSGVAVFNQVEVASGRETEHAPARPPQMSMAGPAVVVTRGGIASFNANTGDFLWHRTRLAHGGVLVQAPAGYLAGELGSMEGLFLAPGKNWSRSKGEVPVREQVRALFDPKRVRAAMAGVPLTSIRF